jgi:DUF4097 and DUF4098 domain-containing protein YvlB
MLVTRRLVASLVAALLALSALGACTGDGPLAVKASASQELTAAVSASGADPTVRVEMFNGSIAVRAGDPGRITATVTTTGSGSSKADAEADRAKIDVALDAHPDGTVVLSAVYQPNPTSPGNRAASATVDVPPGAVLDLRTSNGRVDSTGLGGAITVQTSNGAVNLVGAAQGATVHTSNGGVEVDGGGSLDVETSNAAVVIHGTGATVRVTTSNGSIAFDGTISNAAQSMETSNAGIDLRLPANAGFELDAETSNAAVTLTGFAIRTTGSASQGAMRGTVGSGGPSIRLRTTNAAIVVRAD